MGVEGVRNSVEYHELQRLKDSLNKLPDFENQMDCDRDRHHVLGSLAFLIECYKSESPTDWQSKVRKIKDEVESLDQTPVNDDNKDDVRNKKKKYVEKLVVEIRNLYFKVCDDRVTELKKLDPEAPATNGNRWEKVKHEIDRYENFPYFLRLMEKVTTENNISDTSLVVVTDSFFPTWFTTKF